MRPAAEGSKKANLRDQFFSQAEAAAGSFLQGIGTIDDVRRHRRLGTLGSPSRIASLLLPSLSALAPDSDTTFAVLDRTKQLVQWWESNSDFKSPQLILELARQIPPDEGYHLPTQEVLGHIFTPYNFVFAVEDIAADLAGCRNQIPRTVAGFKVSVRQEMVAQKLEDPSAIFQDWQRNSLVASSKKILTDPLVEADDKVRLAQVTMLAHPLPDKLVLSDSIVLTSLDLTDPDRVSRLTSNELASRLITLFLYRRFPASLLGTSSQYFQSWVYRQQDDQVNPHDQFCASLTRINPDIYTANQPDWRDKPERQIVNEVTSELLAGLFTEKNLLQYLYKYKKGEEGSVLTLTDDEISETSRLIRAIRINLIDRMETPVITDESRRVEIRQVLHPFFVSLPHEAPSDIAAIIISITPEDAQHEIDTPMCDRLLHDKGNFGERAARILGKRLSESHDNTVKHLQERLSGAPLNEQYKTWWKRFADLPIQPLVSFETLDTMIGRLAYLGYEDDVDPSSLAHYSQIASFMLNSLDWVSKVQETQAIRNHIEANAPEAADNLLHACQNLDGHPVDIIGPLVFLVRDLASKYNLVVQDWRVQELLKGLAANIDQAVLSSVKDTIRTLLTPPDLPVAATSQ